jgi:hypothetical protein
MNFFEGALIFIWCACGVTEFWKQSDSPEDWLWFFMILWVPFFIAGPLPLIYRKVEQ